MCLVELHVKTASGRRGGAVEVVVVGGAWRHTGRNFWNSNTVLSFFFFPLLKFLYHENVSRNVTPLSPDSSLITFSGEKRQKRGMREREVGERKKKCT